MNDPRMDRKPTAEELCREFGHKWGGAIDLPSGVQERTCRECGRRQRRLSTRQGWTADRSRSAWRMK